MRSTARMPPDGTAGARAEHGRGIRAHRALPRGSARQHLRASDKGSAQGDGKSPVLDALFAKKEPKTGTDGTMSWTVDVFNPSSGDDFVLMLKELVLPNGQRRPYSVWMAGAYPRALDGLCKLLSLDMRVIDPAWIGMKLRKLLELRRAAGRFHGARAGQPSGRRTFPRTVAYVARLIIHRYAMLGVLDERGYPVNEMGVLEIPDSRPRTGSLRPIACCPASVPGMRQRRGDQEGRLRVLHRLRRDRGVRVSWPSRAKGRI